MLADVWPAHAWPADPWLVGAASVLEAATGYPAALPDHSLGSRQILDEVSARRDLRSEVEGELVELRAGLV